MKGFISHKYRCFKQLLFGNRRYLVGLPRGESFIDRKGEGSGYTDWDGKISIDTRVQFDTSMYVHELLHGSSHQVGERMKGKIGRNGYNTIFFLTQREKYTAFNEGVTEILTLGGLKSHLKDVSNLRKKFYTSMLELQNQYKINGDPLWGNFTRGCQNTGWYRDPYLNEMDLVNSLLDLLSYIRTQKGGEFSEHRNIIWDDLIRGYFHGEFRILRVLLKEIDSSGVLLQKMKSLEPFSVSCKSIVDSIKKQIVTVYDSQYRGIEIPKIL